MATVYYSVVDETGEAEAASNTACFATLRSWDDRVVRQRPVSVIYDMSRGTCTDTSRMGELVGLHQKWLKNSVFGNCIVKLDDHELGHYRKAVVSCMYDPRAVFLTLVHLRMPHEYPNRTRAIKAYGDMITNPNVGIILFHYLASNSLDGNTVRICLPGDSHEAVARTTMTIPALRRMTSYTVGGRDPWYSYDDRRTLFSARGVHRLGNLPATSWYTLSNGNGTIKRTLAAWLLKEAGVKVRRGKSGWFTHKPFDADIGSKTDSSWPVLTREQLKPIIQKLEQLVS